MSDRPGPPDPVVLPVISAAVAAYLDREKSESIAVSFCCQPNDAHVSVWSLRGRELLMEKRQQITVRRDRKR